MVARKTALTNPQFGKGPAHKPGCRCQEDHEAFQHTCPFQAHLPRVEAFEAFEA